MTPNWYGGIIWTNHALERLSQRGISQENALKAFRNPDKSFPGKHENSREYQKYFGEKRVTLIGKQNDQHQWVIVSAWIDPPLPGSIDEKRQKAYKEYRNAKGWKKVFLLIKRQIGF
jgi:uncharacterized DUF497 family protein